MHRVRDGDRGRYRAALTGNPKEIVARGYDAIADTYAVWAATFESPALLRVEQLLELLPEPSRVLDLGCGRGVPFTRRLAERHDVTGVDISLRQIELARSAVPDATFICGDVAKVELEDESFDAVVSLFMLGHVPRVEQANVVGRVAGWLRPGGLALLTMGTSGSEEIDPDWLGAPMYFSSWPVEENRRLLRDAGFELLDDRVVAHHEPGHGDVSFMWVLARKLATEEAGPRR